MTILLYILGVLLGVLITSTVLYILKLRNEVQRLRTVIKEQNKLFDLVSLTAFGGKIKEHLDKKDCDKKDSEPARQEPGNTAGPTE